jgi:hypothetical protein
LGHIDLTEDEADAALHNMGSAMMWRKGKMTGLVVLTAPIRSPRRLCASRFVLFVAAFCGGCAHLPDIGGMPLPSLSGQPPTTYRSLTDIPDPPPVTAPNMSDAAIRLLSQQRGNAEDAAGDLRGEAFTQPNPAPPQVSF